MGCLTGDEIESSPAAETGWSARALAAIDSSRYSTVFDHDSKVTAVIEMSLSSWLAVSIVPGLPRFHLNS